MKNHTSYEYFYKRILIFKEYKTIAIDSPPIQQPEILMAGQEN